MIDRIRYTCIFRCTLISEINLPLCVNSYVLKESIATDSIVDVRLALFVKVDNFCIATAFEVEYTLIIPSLLVITDKQTLRVSRKGRLARTRQAKEDSSILALHISVSRAVH